MLELNTIFTTFLNMSIAASFVCAVILVVRLVLKRAPKIFSYAIWIFVLVRLLTPISFSSSVSIFNVVKPEANQNGTIQFVRGNQTVSQPNVNIPQVIDDNTTQPIVEQPVTNTVKNTQTSQPIQPSNKVNNNPLSLKQALPWIWITGSVLFLFVLVFQDMKLRKKLRFAMKIDHNIYECDEICVPFLYGIIHPKVYLPSGLDEVQLRYIIQHEKVHLARYDYLIKLLATVLLAFHWLNPMMWVAYYLMSEDMEMSCDEAVIRILGISSKKKYSQTLLEFAARPFSTALAFSESRTSSRIKHVLKYKKPQFWTPILAVVILGCLLIPLLTNPRPFGQDKRAIEDAKKIADKQNIEEKLFLISDEESLNEIKFTYQSLGKGKILIKANGLNDIDYILCNNRDNKPKAVLINDERSPITQANTRKIIDAAKVYYNDDVMLTQYNDEAFQSNSNLYSYINVETTFPELSQITSIPINQDQLLINLGLGTIVYEKANQNVTYKSIGVAKLNLTEERLLEIARTIQSYSDQNIYTTKLCAFLEGDVVSCPSTMETMPDHIGPIYPLIKPVVLSSFSEEQDHTTMTSSEVRDYIPVVAMIESTISKIGKDKLGTFVILENNQNTTYYGGLNEDILFRVGDSLRKGQVFGYLAEAEVPTLTLKTTSNKDRNKIDPIGNVKYQLQRELFINREATIKYPYAISEEQYKQVDELVDKTEAFLAYQNRKPYIEYAQLENNQPIHEFSINAQRNDFPTVSIYQKEGEYQFFVEKNYLVKRTINQLVEGYDVEIMLSFMNFQQSDNIPVSYVINENGYYDEGSYNRKNKEFVLSYRSQNMSDEVKEAMIQVIEKEYQTICEVDQQVNSLVEQVMQILSNGEEIPYTLSN